MRRCWQSRARRSAGTLPPCIAGSCTAPGHEQKLYEVDAGEVEDIPCRPLSRDRIYFINAGSVDAQRKREHRLAEFAVFDSDAWSVEFHRVRYDAAATEAKAAVAGYRILPLTDWLYTMRRRLSPT